MSEVLAPMVGKILDIKVEVADEVAEGDEIVTMEAMKMEIPVETPAAGVVKEIKVSQGDSVEAEAVLALIE